MFTLGTQRILLSAPFLAAAAGVFACAFIPQAEAAQPFSTATITKIENRVSLGERQGDRSVTHPAAVSEVLRPSNFLLSNADSRAEIQYPDGSLVRIGQNTVFTFDAATRTLALEKGSLLFHVPKGKGGGVIKTPSLTAAITGTTGKVSVNLIAIIEGEVKVDGAPKPVGPNMFARRNADGSITVDFFDKSKANDGALVNFNGKMPGFPEPTETAQGTGINVPEIPDLRALEAQHRATITPNSVGQFFQTPADRPRRLEVPRPTKQAEDDNRNDSSTNY